MMLSLEKAYGVLRLHVELLFCLGGCMGKDSYK